MTGKISLNLKFKPKTLNPKPKSTRQVYYKDAFEKHAKLFQELGVNPNNGARSLAKSLVEDLGLGV